MLCRLFYLICEGCGQPGEYGDTARDARKAALRAGWKRVPGAPNSGRDNDGKDFCPRCVREGKDQP